MGQTNDRLKSSEPSCCEFGHENRLQERAYLVLNFDLNLPEQVPAAILPRFNNDEPDKSDLLFERIFRREDWRYVLSQSGLDDDSTDYLAQTYPGLAGENDRLSIPPPFIESLYTEIARSIEPLSPLDWKKRAFEFQQKAAKNHDEDLSRPAVLLPGLLRVHDLLEKAKISSLIAYRVLLVVRWLVENCDCDVYRKELAFSLRSLVHRKVGDRASTGNNKIANEEAPRRMGH